MAVKTFTDNTALPASDINTYLNNGGLVYIKSQTIGTAVASQSVSSAFSADYDAYVVTINGGASSAETVLQMTLGAAVTGYYYIFPYAFYATPTTPRMDGGANQTKWVYAGSASSAGLNAVIELTSPYLAKRTEVRAWATSGTSYSGFMTGFLDTATSYTSFAIAANTGTMTGGEIRVYGYRQA